MVDDYLSQVMKVWHLQVGPLPLGPQSTIRPLYKDGHIPYVKRPPNDLPEAAALVKSCPLLPIAWTRLLYSA